jgi:hypothetical protein
LRRQRIAQLVRLLRLLQVSGLTALYGLADIESASIGARPLSRQLRSIEVRWGAGNTATPIKFFARSARAGIIASGIRHGFGDTDVILRRWLRKLL